MSKAALRRLYAQVPGIECKGLCQESCGPITIPMIEYERLVAARGSQPVPVIGHKDGLVMMGFPCPILNLDNGRCTAHQVRPLICRMWGVSEAMPCPYGCTVKGEKLTREQGFKLIDEVTKL